MSEELELNTKYIDLFEEHMRNTLQQHAENKGDSWKRETLGGLIMLMKKELLELDFCSGPQSPAMSKRLRNRMIREECVDIANFALMVYAKSLLLDESDGY